MAGASQTPCVLFMRQEVRVVQMQQNGLHAKLPGARIEHVVEHVAAPSKGEKHE